MRDLFLIGVHESGEFVVLGSNETGDEYRLPLDDAFREAARWETGFDTARKETPVLRPAEVQALIRAGASASEAAERAGWSVEKVRRFEGPVLAERGHIAELAGHAHVRGHSFGQGVELRRLVEERLAERDIDPSMPRWDSRRGEDGQWIVEVRYPAEHQARVAQWRFSRSTMTVAALNDEARAITDDEPAEASDSERSSGSAGPASLSSAGGSGGRAAGSRSLQDSAEESADDDLVADLRERAAARIRRRGTRAATSGVTRLPTGPMIMSEDEHPDRAIHADDELPFDAPPSASAPEPETPADPPQAQDQAEAQAQAQAQVDDAPGHSEPVLDLDVAETPASDKAPTADEENDSQPGAPEPTPESTDEPESPEPSDKPEKPEEPAAAEESPSPEGPVAEPEPAPAPAPKPAPRKRAPRATTKRAAQSRTRATTGAAASKPERPKAQPKTEPKTEPKNEPKPATPKARTTGAGGAKSGSRGRASVPAWDDIMFGAKPGAE